MNLAFEWDPKKDAANRIKHRVSFPEAVSVFGDALAFVFPDEHHSADERREIIVGHSHARRLLVVSFTERSEGRIRIISARRATKREQHSYEISSTT